MEDEVRTVLEHWLRRDSFDHLKIEHIINLIILYRVADEHYILDRMWALYRDNFRDIEDAFRFSQFHTPLLTEIDFTAKPMVLLIGLYSTGKTSFIRYLLGTDFPGMQIAPEPSTRSFCAVMHGRNPFDGLVPGREAIRDPTLPFGQLEPFGSGFANHFSCAEVAAPILDKLTLIDTPGILCGQKARYGRTYNHAEVLAKFSDLADKILIFLDASRLDISDEFKASLDVFKGKEDKIEIVLNKADSLDKQQLFRVHGAVMWSLGKVFRVPKVFRMYIGSFRDAPYQHTENSDLFDASANDLLDSLADLPRTCVGRRVSMEFLQKIDPATRF